MSIIFSFISALLLGVYDVSKKTSLQNNAVLPVLQLSILISALFLTPFLILSRVNSSFESSIFYVPQVDFATHLQLMLKAVIVLTSWLFAYFAIKHLPITIASPIKATQPVWVVIGGLLIFSEKLTLFQGVGVGITLVSFFSKSE